MRILYSHRIQSRDGQSVHVEELVAALIIYRIIYFMIPFVIALLIMAYWEVTLFLEGTRGGGKKTPLAPQELAGKSDQRDRVE